MQSDTKKTEDTKKSPHKIDFLKVEAYDLIKTIENAQGRLKAINKKIATLQRGHSGSIDSNNVDNTN